MLSMEMSSKTSSAEMTASRKLGGRMSFISWFYIFFFSVGEVLGTLNIAVPCLQTRFDPLQNTSKTSSITELRYKRPA